jgi:hypothetical protein
MKENSLIQCLLKEDSNFCKGRNGCVGEISHWSYEENKVLNSDVYRKNKLKVSPGRLPRVLDVSDDKNWNVTNFNQKIEQCKGFDYVGRRRLDQLCLKLVRGLVKEFDTENYDVGKKFDGSSLKKVFVKGVGHDRSRSLQLYPNEKNQIKSTLEDSRSRKDYIKLTLSKKNCKTEDLSLILEGKGEVKYEKSQISNTKRSSSNISSTVLPQIRSKSTITNFSLFNSGVPTIYRF